MKHIQLTQDQFAIVDDEDFEWLSQVKWFAWWNRCTRSFYAGRQIRLPNGKQTMVQMHRAILGVRRGDKQQVDHVNHGTLDNRRANIRIVTHGENQQNTRCKGYSWNKVSQQYVAYITVDRVRKHLGYHNSPMDAHVAYLFAKAVYHQTAPLVVMV